MRYLLPSETSSCLSVLLDLGFQQIRKISTRFTECCFEAPLLRSKKEQQDYQTYIEEFKKWKDEVWNETLDQEGFCTGRDLVWDIDDCYGDMDALTASAKVAELLKSKYV